MKYQIKVGWTQREYSVQRRQALMWHFRYETLIVISVCHKRNIKIMYNGVYREKATVNLRKLELNRILHNLLIHPQTSDSNLPWSIVIKNRWIDFMEMALKTRSIEIRSFKVCKTLHAFLTFLILSFRVK